MSEEKLKADHIKTMLENIQPRIIPVEGDGKKAEVLLVPNGMEAEGVKKFLDAYNKVPERRKGTHKADRLESFIDLTNRFKDSCSVIFARGNVSGNSISASLTAILDFHPEDADNTVALNCEHKVSYQFPVSKEFSFWLKNNAEGMDQSQFALMLEERISEMSVATDADCAQIENLKPKFAAPVDILELARNLEIYSSESVQQAVKLSSGEREIKFTAVHNGADGKPVSIPDFFVLNIPIFEGERPVRILVRLRYRKQGNGVLWFYDLYRVDMVFQEAFDKALEKVKEGTKLPLFLGSAD